MAGNSKISGRSVISKVSAILLSITEGNGYTLTEIATRSGMPLSTVHRLVNELAAWGLLERDDKGHYRAGPPIKALGRDDPSSVALTWPILRERLVPVLDDLFRATGAPVRAGFLTGSEVAYVEKACAHLPVSALSAAARLPAHATALGKALMAFSPAATVDLIVAHGLKRYSRTTITRPERLRSMLRTVRGTRLAVSDGELDEDWRGVAAPVFGPGGCVVAAVELRVRDLTRDLAGVRAALIVAASGLSRDLTAAAWPAAARPLRTSDTHWTGGLADTTLCR